MSEKNMSVMHNWKIEDIIDWCIKNNQLAWLEEASTREVEHKVYPKVESISKTGKKTKKQDKTQEPIAVVNEPMNFTELRKLFFDTFITTTPKEKELTMQEKIAIAIKAARGE